ncbi:hypothetical protein KKF34_09795 [Myxococcota bacterium]|nr:hypothetical protein [Myxococcota bacterium]MBU1380579.1 hypothetical protein [Myxococcota bacterium]MBU1497157.1 hypothetical protein [Myxococcota bacterium]
MSVNQFLEVAVLVVGPVGVLTIMWFWFIRDEWESRRAWKEIERYRGFGLRWNGSELTGSVEGVYLKVMPSESAIVVPLQREADLQFANVDQEETNSCEADQQGGDEQDEEAKKEMVRFHFGVALLDEYFNFAEATPSVRKRLLANHRALEVLQEMVNGCKDEPVCLDFYCGMFRLTLQAASKGRFAGIRAQQVDLWLPRLVKWVQQLDAVMDFGRQRKDKPKHWMWTW